MSKVLSMSKSRCVDLDNCSYLVQIQNSSSVQESSSALGLMTGSDLSSCWCFVSDLSCFVSVLPQFCGLCNESSSRLWTPKYSSPNLVYSVVRKA